MEDLQLCFNSEHGQRAPDEYHDQLSIHSPEWTQRLSLIRNRELFEDLVRVLFTQRRRKLLGVLTRFLEHRYPDQSDQVFSRITIPEKRIFEITPQEFATLSDQIEEALTNNDGAS
jgi:16S rRNA A1518/A1519 N6-dimethyltransferase RsmA/KsgA/DIM1 with predicted DNA glycosylase/AP lyase activity